MKKILVGSLIGILLLAKIGGIIALPIMGMEYVRLMNVAKEEAEQEAREREEAERIAEQKAKEEAAKKEEEEKRKIEEETRKQAENASVNSTGNCTLKLGKLMLINANFTVDMNYINTRRAQLVNLTEVYGINELNSYNGVPLLDVEAGAKLNEMIKAYKEENPDHEMKTVSCFRTYGTKCGRLCAATGTSEHHSGYTCDLIDAAYGTTLDTGYYDVHKEWQWLKANSYKYGFIDRYPVEWAGGSMAQPLNVNEDGTTGYYETWHYRYVGNPAATEIATGKYNSGKYDSLEHYLKMAGYVKDLRAGSCN